MPARSSGRPGAHIIPTRNGCGSIRDGHRGHQDGPSEFTLHARNPAHDLQLGGDWTAFGTVGSPPNVSDLDRGRRIGNREDYQNLLRLGQMLTAVHFLAGYPVEPVDLHHGVRYLHATLDALTLMDKAIHCYSLGKQTQRRRARDGPRLAGIDDATIDREPSVFTVVNSSSPLRLDAPMLQGIMEFARRGQIVCITPFTLAGAMAPVTLAGALSEQNAEALAGMVLTQVVRPGAPASTAALPRTWTCSRARRRSGRPSTCGPR